MVDLSKYDWLTKSIKPIEGQDSKTKDVLDAIDKKNWTKVRKYFMGCYFLDSIFDLSISKDVGKDIRSWEKSNAYKKVKERIKEEDYTKFNIASIFSMMSFCMILMFMKAVIIQSFVISFSVDAIVACVCLYLLIRNYMVRYRLYSIYTEDTQYLKLDVTAAIFCVLMKILVPSYIDLTIFMMIVLYVITVRKKFKNILKNC